MTAPPTDVSAILSDLRRAIVSSQRGPTRLRRRAIALAAAALALVLGAAAFALSRTSAERVADDVACHNEPRLASSRTGIVGADGRDPVEICAEVDWHGNAPPLVACANEEHGHVDVFPSRDPGLCERLGLAPLPPRYAEEAERFDALREDITARFLKRRCVPEDEARRLARDALNRHGYPDWTIETLRFSSASPCAELWFDTRRGVLGLTGGAVPPG